MPESGLSGSVRGCPAWASLPRFLAHKRRALSFVRFIRIRCGMRSEISESLRDFGDLNNCAARCRASEFSLPR
jgi:hypothetical protein